MTDYVPLLDMTSPRLYRSNLFRVLDLSVTASNRDVRRNQKRMEARTKLGLDVDESSTTALTLQPGPNEQEIRSALERINDPEQRFLHEFFWFWPTNGDGGTDSGLNSIKSGHVENAVQHWFETSENDNQGPIALHNLAVYYHLKALDTESKLSNSDSPKGKLEQLQAWWNTAHRYWMEVVEGEAFWISARDRIRSFDDQKLKTGLVSLSISPSLSATSMASFSSSLPANQSLVIPL